MSEARFRRLLVLAGVIGAVHALVYAPFVAARVKDSEVYIASAKALRHGSYTTPLRVTNLYDTGDAVADLTDLPLPKAAWSAPERQTVRTPGYPLFLAVLGGGGGTISEALVVIAQALLLGTASLLLGLAFRPLAGERVALVAAWLYALDPWSRHDASLVLTETLAAFSVALLAFTLVRAWRLPSARHWAVVGAVAGAATLVRPALSLAVPVVLVGALLRGRLRAGAAAAAAAAVLLVTWLGWTASVLGKPALTSLSQGTSMLFATYDDGPGKTYQDIVENPAYLRDARSPHRFAPPLHELLTDPEAHPRYLLRADEEYRRIARERYRDRLADDPLDVLWDYGYRAWALYRAPGEWPELEARLPAAVNSIVRALNGLVTLLALAGAVLLVRRSAPGRLLVAFVAAYTAASALFHVEARYGMPIRGLVVAFASSALIPLAASVRLRIRA